jgi:hypothetical protein
MSRATAAARSMCVAAEKGCTGRGHGMEESGQADALGGSRVELCVDRMIECEPEGRDGVYGTRQMVHDDKTG